MHSIRPIRRVAAQVGLVAALIVATSSRAVVAGPPAGAEFDRITADIRASIERHDARALHAYELELKQLVAEATTR